jgi:hydrogenase expression/formation protein HypC
MCIAIPSKVLSVNGFMAKVECYGVEREVSLLFQPDTRVGDYVLIQVGHVIERIDEAAARESLSLFDQVLQT